MAELCRRLDGLPLAIELVAARIKLLPLAELLVYLRGPWLLSTDGLRDVSARQKTLRGAIGWSYDLLSPAEQTLFTRLAVFVGGCTMEAAQAVCADGASSFTHVLDGMASLLDKSLLHRETGLYGEPRYVMLETVREYALERLALSGHEAALREWHANCFLRIIENAEQTDLGPRHIQLLRQIDDEIHNMRAALAWAMEHHVQAALLLTATLLGWFHERGLLAEGKRLIDAVLTPPAAAHTIPRAQMLLTAAFLLSCVNKVAEAQAYAEEGLALSQELGYAKGEADAFVRLGRIAHIGWYDLEAACRYLERALASYRILGDLGGICYALVVFSEVALLQGDYPKARALAEECLTVARQAGFHFPGRSLLWPRSPWVRGT